MAWHSLDGPPGILALGDFVPSTPGTAGSTEEDGLAAKPQWPFSKGTNGDVANILLA